MPVDFLIGATQYLDHMYPIARALPARERGLIYLVHGASHAHSLGVMQAHVKRFGMQGCVSATWSSARAALTWRSGPLVVASATEAAMAAHLGRPVVYCEHGAGQTYSTRHPSYAGGEGRPNVTLFLCPNKAVAQRNRRHYGTALSVVVGCPKLDQYHVAPRKPRETPPVVALAFHWRCKVAPEADTAFDHYRAILPDLAKRYHVLGHGHPRMMAELEPVYERAGIEVVRDFEEILARADLLCCDNSSVMFEFASTGRPVVVLNCPKYRRRVHHGLRFWEAATVGVQVGDQRGLIRGIEEALADSPQQKDARRRAVALAYTYSDGRAAVRASGAIRKLMIRSAHMILRSKQAGTRRAWFGRYLVAFNAEGVAVGVVQQDAKKFAAPQPIPEEVIRRARFLSAHYELEEGEGPVEVILEEQSAAEEEPEALAPVPAGVPEPVTGLAALELHLPPPEEPPAAPAQPRVGYGRVTPTVEQPPEESVEPPAEDPEPEEKPAPKKARVRKSSAKKAGARKPASRK